jgi:hypothetical protein
MKVINLILSLLVIAMTSSALAQTSGLLINATEVGVGKFHRYDNKQHPYDAKNVWAPHIMPDNAKATPIIFSTGENAVTIQFSSLEQLLQSIILISQQKQMKVGVLNINGHGMPGGMWYPKDDKQGKSFECLQWNQAANEDDVENYNEYYSAVQKSEIMQLRASSQSSHHYACVTGAPEWKEVVERNPAIKTVFTNDAQIHFESCLVGLGAAGEVFTNAVASLVLTGDHAMVKTSTNFGLGDWSMPEGMGFWDFFTDEQLDTDNRVYPINKRDREIMKKGVIRVATQSNGRWSSSLVADQDFMLVGFQKPGFSNSNARVLKNYHMPLTESEAPATLHIPGTARYSQRMN